MKKWLFLIVGLLAGIIIGGIGKTFIDMSKQSANFDKKLDCLRLGDQRKEESGKMIDLSFYSSALDTCIVSEWIYNGGEPIYELIDIIERQSIGLFEKELQGENYYNKYLERIKSLR